MTTERAIIWHKTGRVLGAYRFAYDSAGVATLEELHDAGWSALELGNQAAGGGSGGTGGASALSDLSDVQVSNPPGEGHVLTWDSGTAKWVNATPSGGSGGVDAEGVQDTIGAMFAGGVHENVTVTYDDTAGTLSLVVAGGGEGGLTQEQIEDLVALMVGGTHSGIAFAYDDASGTLTATVSGFQPADATLSALATLDTTPGLVEQTAPDSFAKRPFGVGGAASVPTRADADARYAALVHGHTQSEVVGLTASLAGKIETSLIGAVNGVAPLNSVQKLPSSYLEVVPSEEAPVFPAGGTIPSLTVAEQALVSAGTVVVQSNGQRYMYTGTGSKTATASYVLLSDLSPDWAEISNVPATFPPTAHTHPQADVTGLTAALAAKAPLVDPAFTRGTGTTATVGDASTLLATTAFVSATVGTGGYGAPNKQEQRGAVSTGVTSGEQVIGTATAALTGRHSASVVRVWGAVAITKGTGTTSITWTVRLRRGTSTAGTLLATATAASALAGDSFTVPVEGFDALGAVAGQYVITVQGSAGNGTITYYQTTALEVGGAPGPTGPAGPPGATTLDGLSDVVIASPATDQVLKYSGTGWVNGTASGGGALTDGSVSLAHLASATRRSTGANILEWIPAAEHAAILNGTSTTDLTSYFQAAIDAVSPLTYLGVIEVPGGRYVTDQLTAKSGVIFRGSAPFSRGYSNSMPRLYLKPASAAASMFTAAVTTVDFGLEQFYISGMSQSDSKSCVVLADANGCSFNHLYIENFGASAIKFIAGLASTVHNVTAFNINQSTGHAADVGTLDIGGTEHWVTDCEICAGVGAVGSGSHVTANQRNIGVVVRGSGNWFSRVFSEFGDKGWLFTNSAGNNRVDNCVGDNCTGQGFHIHDGCAENGFVNCVVHRCGHHANNTYDGWHDEGIGSRKIGCVVRGNGDANQVRYGFYDYSFSGSDRRANYYGGGTMSLEHRTKAIHNGVDVKRLSYDPPFKNPVDTVIVGTNQTASADQLGYMQLRAAATASVASFSNGQPGQRMLVDFADANVTLVHGANLQLPGGVNVAGSTSLLLVAYCKDGTVWQVSPIRSDDTKLSLSGGTLTGGVKVRSGAVTGALSNAYSGGVYTTSGNVTLPNEAGFSVTLIAGGAHTVGAGGATTSLASGDMLSVVVPAVGTVRAVKVLAADVTTLATA